MGDGSGSCADRLLGDRRCRILFNRGGVLMRTIKYALVAFVGGAAISLAFQSHLYTAFAVFMIFMFALAVAYRRK